MPAFSPVVLTDGTSPLTFNPKMSSKGKFIYEQAGSTTSIEATKVDVIISQTKDHNRVYFRVVDPQTAISADSGRAEVVDKPAYCEISFAIPHSMTAAERLSFCKRALDVNNAAAFKKLIELGEGLWA